MNQDEQYSALDRILYRIAFGNLELQRDLSKLEDSMFAGPLAEVRSRSPVFITAVPRAGTTLLLEILTKTPDFASHTYRDLPFILMPVLWEKISSGFHRRGTLRERAHGDGMQIGYDSPEAFEEVIWTAFYPEHYRGSRIKLWTAQDTTPELEDFLSRHMRKIIWLRSSGGNGHGRYLSKNNANIARLPLLRKLFPDCVIVVPFREPLEQANSLLTQHRRFLALHQRSPFTRDYMRWIGHREFGANLLPFAFKGLENLGDAETIDFWLRYWIAAYEHILGQQAGQVYISHEGLCAAPGLVLDKLAQILSLPEGALNGDAIRQGGKRREPIAADESLVQRAAEIYRVLTARSCTAIPAQMGVAGGN